MGDDGISERFRAELELELDQFHTNLTNTSKSWDKLLIQFSNSMQQSMDDVQTYFEPNELEDLHDTTKNYIMDQVWSHYDATIANLTFA